MRKIFFYAMAIAMGSFALSSCVDDDDEPKIEYDVVDFEGTYFSSLIDSPQYGGALLYSSTGSGYTTEASAYTWTDPNTTLTSTLEEGWGAWCYWNGGMAISNYIDADLTHNSYSYQLAVPASNGSSNFCTVYCPASMSFKDGKARTIVSMVISPTTYELGICKSGDGYANALTSTGDYLKLTITGYNGSTETGTVDVDMAKDGTFLSTWTLTNLTSLGAVTKLSFSMTGSDTSSYGGIKTPMYCAIDDITILK